MTVHTDRLRLEPIDPTRADELWQLHQDPGVAAWYGGTWSRPEAAARAVEFGRAWAADGVGTWLAYSRAGGELIGRGGVSITTVDGDECVELGWGVRQELWGRGYARRSVRQDCASLRTSSTPTRSSPTPRCTTSGPAR